MAEAGIELRAVEGREGAAARGVLAQAFADDPNLRWCFAGDAPGFEARLHAYLEAGHAWHTSVGHPVHGAFRDGELVGVVYAMDPARAADAASLRRLEESLLRGVGRDGAARFARYNRAVERVAPEAPHHVIALVGVRPALQGNGIGSRLVAWACRRADADPDSAGVLLDTATERNLPFYRRLGFDVHAEVRLDGLREWVLARPRAG